MRRRALLAALAAGLLLPASACAAGGGGGSDLDAVAAAIRAVEDRGATIQSQLTEIETGADIPRGKYAEQVYVTSGAARDDRAAVTLGTKDPASGKTTLAFDLVVDDSNVYVRPRGSTRAWFTTYTFAAEEFIPGVRLNLVRETVLLAARVSRSTTFSGGSFVNQYTVTPAGEQLRQLMGFASSGTVTATTSASNGQLRSLAFHFAGTDSASKRHLVVDSSLTIGSLGRVQVPRLPGNAVNVQPADLFSTSLTAP